GRDGGQWRGGRHENCRRIDVADRRREATLSTRVSAGSNGGPDDKGSRSRRNATLHVQSIARRRRGQPDMLMSSAVLPRRDERNFSRSSAASRSSSQSLQRTANGSARNRCSEISSPHSKQLP